MRILDKIKEGISIKNEKYQKKINVRFPNFSGDRSGEMTIQELKDKHSECMLINPQNGTQVTHDDIEVLDLREVVAMPPIRGGSGE